MYRFESTVVESNIFYSKLQYYMYCTLSFSQGADVTHSACMFSSTRDKRGTLPTYTKAHTAPRAPVGLHPSAARLLIDPHS